MSAFSKKTIMILGAGQLQVPIIQRAKERDLRVIVVSPGKDDPGLKYADEIVALDVKDEVGILNAARFHKIDGITTDQTDLPVRTAAYVSEKMGLPGIGYQTGCLFTDKYAQRKRCTELGIPTPKYTLAKSVEDVERFCTHFPVIIKPVDSQASHGVSKITDRTQILECFEDAVKYSRKGDVLVEEWIEGIEFPVDSYVKDGVPHMLAVGQYHPFEIEGVFSSYQTVYPARQPDSIIALLRETNEAILRGFGLKNGRTHAEYIVSNGKCYLVEIGARGGGSFFSSDNIRYVSGFCTEDYLINYALGTEDPLGESAERYATACTLFFYLPEGEVVDIKGIDAALNYDYVRRHNLDQIWVGLKTRPIIDKGARYFLTLVANSHEELDEHIDQIRNTIKAQVRTDEGFLATPIWM